MSSKFKKYWASFRGELRFRLLKWKQIIWIIFRGALTTLQIKVKLLIKLLSINQTKLATCNRKSRPKDQMKDSKKSSCKLRVMLLATRIR